MTVGQKQELFSQTLALFIILCANKGFGVRLREVQRTPEQQEIYLKSGKTKTKNSKHLNSLAADLYFTKEGKLVMAKKDLQELGDLWETLCVGNSWGGNWTNFIDCPHFEYNG